MWYLNLSSRQSQRNVFEIVVGNDEDEVQDGR